jgi:hypothetical protein
MVLPGTVRSLSAGRITPTGWLLWEGPYTPVPVRPLAVELLRGLLGGLHAACESLFFNIEQVSEIFDELVVVGVLTASEI